MLRVGMVLVSVLALSASACHRDKEALAKISGRETTDTDLAADQADETTEVQVSDNAATRVADARSQLILALTKMATQCEIEQGSVFDCGGADEEFATLIASMDPALVVETLASYINNGSDNQVDLGAFLLLAHFGAMSPEAQAAMTASVAQSLLKGLSKADGVAAEQLAQVATQVATLTNLTPALVEFLTGQPDARKREVAYQHLMRFGGADVLNHVKMLSSDPNTSPAELQALVEGALMIDELDATTKLQICPWMEQGFLTHPNDDLSARASQFLVRCGDSFLIKTLPAIGQRVKDGTVTAAHLAALQSVCGEAAGDDAPGANTCEQVRRLLVEAGESDALTSEVRAVALEALGRQWDNAETEAFLEDVAATDDATLQRAANEALRALGGIAQE